MKNIIVADASAILAFLMDEPGAKKVAQNLDKLLLSSVNFCEVASKFSERGMPEAEIEEVLSPFSQLVVPFDSETALIAGNMRKASRDLSLSLGDRACLALGKKLGALVYTCDAAWAKVRLGVEIEVIR